MNATTAHTAQPPAPLEGLLLAFIFLLNGRGQNRVTYNGKVSDEDEGGGVKGRGGEMEARGKGREREEDEERVGEGGG